MPQVCQRFFTFSVILLLLAGCAGKNHDNTDMRANLEPELWDNTLILKDLKRGRPLTPQEKEALASRGSIHFNLDVTENEEVQMFLQYFTIDKRGSIEKWLSRAEPHLPYVRAVLASYNLPPDLIVLPIIESGYNTMAYSPVGAGGMWQFMPYTARRFGLTVNWWVDERRDPYKATVAAAKYLTKLYQMFGDWNLALAAYNAGEGKVSKAMACSGQTDFFDLARNTNLLKAETRHYVPKFLAVLKIFQNLQSLGFRKINWQAGPNLKEVRVPGGTDLLALAQACGLTWEQFRQQNAAFRRQVSPPEQTTNVYVPVAKEQLALAYLRHPDATQPAGYHQYAAASGDTWWALARRTGVPIAALRAYNSSLPEVLGPGQTVRVPNNASFQEATAMAAAPDACAPIRAQAAAKQVRHRVNRGETIASIARRYGVSVGEIKAANRIRSNHLPLGTTLVIPTPMTKLAKADPSSTSKSRSPNSTRHAVHRGESLSGIAARYGVSSQELLAANHLRSARDLKAGSTLRIPGHGTPEPAAMEPRKGTTTTRRAKALSDPSLVKAFSSPTPAKAFAKAESHAKAGAAPKPSRQVASAKPAAKVPAAAKPAGRAVNYKVNPGETVWGIAKKFNVQPSSLMAWNNMKNPGSLQAGKRITIFKE